MISTNLYEMQKTLKDTLGAFQRVHDWVIAGLLVEGGHHKQYCLEQIVATLGVEVDEEWEPGIAP